MGHEPPNQLGVIQTDRARGSSPCCPRPLDSRHARKGPGLRKERSDDVCSPTRPRACRARVQQDTGAAALAAGYEAVVGRGAGSRTTGCSRSRCNRSGRSMLSITRTPTRVRTVSFAESSRSRLVRAGRRQRGRIALSRDPCPTVAQLEHIALATNDVEGLRDFYLQLGGVASPPCTDPDTGLHSCVLDFCGVRIELLERPGDGEGATMAMDSRQGFCISASRSDPPTRSTSSAELSPRPGTGCSSRRTASASSAPIKASSSTPTATR